MMYSRSSFFWDVILHRLLVGHRCFGPILKGYAVQEDCNSRPSKVGPIGCPETLVTSYQPTPCSIPGKESLTVHSDRHSMSLC